MQIRQVIGLVFVLSLAFFAGWYFSGNQAQVPPSEDMPATSTLATTTDQEPQTQATSSPVMRTNEKTFTAYFTGYGWPDNTPPGVAVSNPVIHDSAGGMGTFADPITVAVGHSIINGKDYVDYPAGTKFYIPNFRKYFIVEDTCGDGDAPQNGPCHTGYQGHPWLDLWVGGEGAKQSDVFDCEDEVTGLFVVIQNPAANYAVSAGEIYANGSCARQFGDAIVTR